MSAPDPHPVGEDDLHGLVDGRLDPRRRDLVEAWLAAHPEVAAQVAADRALRGALRARLASIAEEAIPARLRIANIARRRSVWRTRWFPASAAAVICLCLGGAAGWLGRGAASPADITAPEPVTQAAVSAFRTFVVEAAHPVEVRAEEKPHLVQWLSKRLGRSLTAPDLRAQGFRLMGGRLLPAGLEPAAMLMYDDDRGTRLTVYSRIGRAEGRSVFRYAREGDVAAFSWVDEGMAYVVTARTDEARLLTIAEAVNAQVRGSDRDGL